MFTYRTRLVRCAPASGYGTLFPVYAIVASWTFASTHCQPSTIGGRTNVDDSVSSPHGCDPHHVVDPTHSTVAAAATIVVMTGRATRGRTNAAIALMAATAKNARRDAGATMPSSASQPPMNHGT